MTDITPSTPYGHTIFCDDVRQEIGGKTSLMGIYKGTLVVQGPAPVTLPRLCLHSTFIERPDESNEPIELQITMPGDAENTPSIRIEIPANFRDQIPKDPELDDPRLSLEFQSTISQLVIKQDGYITIRARRGRSVFRIGRLRVKVNPAAPAIPAQPI